MSEAGTLTRDDPAAPGASFYDRRRLRIYGPLIRFNCRVLWRCPIPRLVDHYREHVTSDHLDIGVGDGALLDSCGFPDPDPRITLMDLNEDALTTAAERIARYNPTVHRGNALEPFGLPESSFGSVGLSMLLHCLPGDILAKGVVFEHARDVLRPGGVVFGATVLNGGVPQTRASRRAIAGLNRRGVFCNLDDDLDGLTSVLAATFPDHQLTTVGCVALFSGRRPE